MTIVARVFDSSASNSVRTTYRRSQRPCILSIFVDIVDKYLFKSIFTISSMAAEFRIGHPSLIPATFLICDPAELKAISEFLR